MHRACQSAAADGVSARHPVSSRRVITVGGDDGKSKPHNWSDSAHQERRMCVRTGKRKVTPVGDICRRFRDPFLCGAGPGSWTRSLRRVRVRSRSISNGVNDEFSSITTRSESDRANAQCTPWTSGALPESCTTKGTILPVSRGRRRPHRTRSRDGRGRDGGRASRTGRFLLRRACARDSDCRCA
jgi:hypothetical protein